MNADRWQAIGDLFERALPLSAGDRAPFLEEACADDPDLRGEVLSLLTSHDAAGGFVQNRIKGAVAAFCATSLSMAGPARAGPYRLVRELGRGGMGTVFLAERDDDQYHARVAVKLVRPGMDTEFILGRFRRERQTLARLEHPNISRLLDGGTTEDGLPYIVMEYIDGLRLTDYADTHALTIEARLRMFLDVCGAVDYAHRNFIVHRDLKPGNILVDAQGVPKLLDFGVCKLLRTESIADDDTVEGMLTPRYASPEQLRGEPVTPLSDIYSLGAVFYELLVGKVPRHFEKLTPEAIESVLSGPAIAPPSAVAGDVPRSRRLSGDLDNIAMCALESDPQRRYPSAASFADDLRRHLDHEPIRARPQAVIYRALKFVRRHRVRVAAAVTVCAALSIGLAVSIYQNRIAASRLRQLKSLAGELVFGLHDAIRDLPGATLARRKIVETGLLYLDASAESVKGDPSAEKELARAYRRLGDVQGYVQGSNLGDPEGALARYRSALALLDDAVRLAPQDLEAATELLIVFRRMGTLQAYTRRLSDAVRTLRDGIELGAPLSASGDPNLTAALADLYLGSSEARRNMGDDRGAVQDATECLRLYQQTVERRPSDPDLRQALSNAYAAVGMAESGTGRLNEALSHYRRGVEEMVKLVASAPNNVSWSRDLMLAHGHVADVLGNPDMQNLGDREGALEEYRKAAEIGKRLHEADRADMRAATDYGIVLSRLETAMDDGDVPAKVAVQRESLQVLEEASRISPGDVSLWIYRSLVQQHLGDAFAAGGQLEPARRAYQESVELAASGIETGHASLLTLYIQSSRRLALNAVVRGHRDEALRFARQALRASETSPPGATALRAAPRGYAAMGLTYEALSRSHPSATKDREEALSWLTRSLEAWRAAQAEAGFAAPHRREMHEVEEALSRVRQHDDG